MNPTALSSQDTDARNIDGLTCLPHPCQVWRSGWRSFIFEPSGQSVCGTARFPQALEALPVTFLTGGPCYPLRYTSAEDVNEEPASLKKKPLSTVGRFEVWAIRPIWFKVMS